jgi:DNA-binding NtrC family response regulator
MAKILIVEDEPIPRMILNKILTRDGHDVRVAATAGEAIDTGAAFNPEILIADWLLTDVNSGLSVAEKLRELNPQLHILFFTGLPTHKLQTEAQHLRPFRFLEKPCEFDTLRIAIKEVLSDENPSEQAAANN